MKDLAVQHVEDSRREWAEAKLAEVAPALADVPDRVNRFLANVQRMLAASNGAEASRFASEVACEAATVALLSVEHRRLLSDLMARAPVETMRVTVQR